VPVEQILKRIQQNQGNGRLERKVQLNLGQSLWAHSELLKEGFAPVYNPRKVTSLYFDDFNFKFARGNINGDRYRLKPRIRWYEENWRDAVLELKYRDGFLGFKDVEKMQQLESVSFHDVLLSLGDYLYPKIKEDVLPSALVSYDRVYFEHPSGVRATIDTEIGCCSPDDFFNSRTSWLEPMNFEVLEFKYQPAKDFFFRKEIFPSFFGVSFRLTKCSKYVESITKLLDLGRIIRS